ncbi:hypothetical protein C8F01DRAFT_986193 [Mycena amicta]|nr:hypothetical protein C8F01DRAFT_986193 [Mycena amicta]
MQSDHLPPKTLIIHDPDYRVSETASTIPYRRILPAPTHSTVTEVAHLHLTRASRIGCGHHSNVYRAVLQSTTVVAKIAVPRQAAREFLEHEAKIYDGLSDLERVVPRFFGYYVPDIVMGDSSPSPILLLEECGEPIDPATLSDEDKTHIIALFHRLHGAGYLQKSPFRKNILVQPASSSFRIIDLGRAVRRSEEQEQEWVDETKEEVREVMKLLRMKVPRRVQAQG